MKKIAKEYRFLVKEINQLKSHISEIDIEYADYHLNTELYNAYIDLKSILNDRLNYCENQCQIFEEWISTIDNPTLKHIVFLRYVKGLPYVKISEQLYISADAAKMQVHRLLKKSAKKRQSENG